MRIDRPTWMLVLIVALWSVGLAGCEDDPIAPDVTTTPSPDPDPDPDPTPEETLVTFTAVNVDHLIVIQLDGAAAGTLSGNGGTFAVHIEPGSHSYWIQDRECGLSSEPVRFRVDQGEHLEITVNPQEHVFPLGKPAKLRASLGEHVGAVTLDWTMPRSSGTPAYYEVIRDGKSLRPTRRTEYTDGGATPLTEHTYRVRAVYRCGTGPWSDEATGYLQAAAFANPRSHADNEARRAYVYFDLRMWGFQDQTKAIAVYWFRRERDGYRYQPSNCSRNNTYGNWLGFASTLTPGYAQTIYRDHHIWVSYNCWTEFTGVYYGMVKLYSADSISHPNDQVLATTVYVRFEWITNKAGEPEVRILPVDPEERRALDAAVSTVYDAHAGPGCDDCTPANPGALGGGTQNDEAIQSRD